MNVALDRTLLSEVSGFIADRVGLHFPEERWPDLVRGFTSASHDLGFEDPDAFVRGLLTRELTIHQIETLASHLTVGETYFFRDPDSFELVEQEILPSLVARRSRGSRSLRLWSAGCCTGEEAYSLAISCARALPDLRAWNVSILATDINTKFLARAEAGVYSEWSFRGSPGWLRERFFSPVSKKMLAIDPAVKNLVQFGYLNLAEDSYPSLYNHTNAMDLIFCRNVLMYFTPGHQQRVVAALHRCLVDGGCLIVNPVEVSGDLFSMFSMENHGGVILFRKTSRPADLASPPGPVPAAPAVRQPEPVFVSLPVPPVPVTSVSQVLMAQPDEPIVAPPQEDPLELARSCADQGRLDDALEWCRKAIAADRTNPVAHSLYAMICHELGRLDEAIVALGKVLYLNQDSILAHHALGGIYHTLDKRKESRRHMAIVLKLLGARNRDDIVPESDGMTCGRLVESIHVMMGV